MLSRTSVRRLRETKARISDWDVDLPATETVLAALPRESGWQAFSHHSIHLSTISVHFDMMIMGGGGMMLIEKKTEFRLSGNLPLSFNQHSKRKLADVMQVKHTDQLLNLLCDCSKPE